MGDIEPLSVAPWLQKSMALSHGGEPQVAFRG
jgi:hypothetical protein